MNAFEAMPAGGWLTFSTRLEADEVVVEVVDTGEGIAPEDIRRIYDPFFSTRKKTGGNGLGLAISYGIVQEHGGEMEVESGLHQGTRFRLSFPAVVDAGAARTASVSAETGS